jgi:SAM-dependent methyltransferase
MEGRSLARADTEGTRGADHPRTTLDRYRLAAWIYDAATAAWSGGAIWRTRARCLDRAAPGSTLFLPGPGTGRLAVEAARRGVQVTAVDRSPRMLARCQRRATRAGVQVDFRLGDAREVPLGGPHDTVVLEHFLNVFPRREMERVRDQMIELVRPGGILAVADFAPLDPRASGLARLAQRLHHVTPLGGCALLTGNAMHPIYDHGLELEGRPDLRLEAVHDERSFGLGPAWFRCWVFRRLEGPR